ncbi:methyl-accepting chemotaxis protein [Vibrio sp. T187]|uniref:methyl-accepting chemotaxis protein n=1 Tax=Vibrio TaxID=662 RepID=UPI0010CA046F|nr:MULTISPECIES: methyl-accepting chemotaxis protein [Vibrio]MBW3695026.1 methyl-accepting chemotaxis protein [Vibrio sp. T187]
MLAKFLTPVLGLLILLTIILATYLPYIEEQALINAAKADAITTVSQFKTLRGYYTKNVVGKAKAFGMKPHYQHSGKDNIPLPATLVHELSEAISTQGLSIKLFSDFPFPNRKSRQLSVFERTAWTELKANPEQPFINIEETNQGPMLHVALADTMQAQGCVDCHNSHPETPKNDWKLGDVRGVLAVTKPLAPIYAQANEIRFKIIMVTVLGTLTIAIVLYYLFKKIVLERTEKLKKSLTQLAQGEGDLSAHLEVGDRDQIGEVAEQFNLFLTKFKGIVESIIHNANDVERSISNVKDTTNAIADKINVQEQQTQQITSAVHQVTHSIKDISSDTEVAADNTRETDEEIKQSSADMLSSVDDIKRLAASMTESAKVIEQLSDHSDQIGSVLDVIKSISEQTNLLALNAAIEAARAGEQGRGFAVVADEVRALAHRTQESVSSIQETVDSLQLLAKQAVDGVNQNIETTSRAEECVDKVAARLEHSKQLESAIAASISSIAGAMEQQAEMSTQMESNIDVLQASSVESNQDLQRLTEQLEHVSSQANLLTLELGKFKL